MPIQTVLSQRLTEQLDTLRQVLMSAQALSDKLSDKESSDILRVRLAQLQSAALFVIVGEVKSGKSSFVNALLGEDVCEVSPDPCTAGIQELVFGNEISKETLGNHWERVHLPKPVLKEISIVDTPGTNSIIRNHQAITENYIPLSDLVIFVFSAKNPHTASAWDLLAIIRKDWHRKIVFVLQQADLASQHELSTNQECVRQYAHERNVQNPLVFTVSAKREKDGAMDSGFTEFRQFLRNAVESGEVWRMKVDGVRDTARRIVSKLLTALRKEEAAIADDKAFYQELNSKVEARREKAHFLQHLVVDSLAATYDRLSFSLEADFSEGLGVGNVLRRSIPFIRDRDIRTWLKELQSQFERRAKEEIDAESLRVSKDLSDEMQTMFDDLLNAIANRQKNREERSPSVSSNRSDVIKGLRAKLEELRVSDIVGERGMQGSDLGSLTLAGGGIVALGALIAIATKIMFLDITGGILAAVGIGLVALTLLWKRSGILHEFRQKLTKSRADFRDRLNQEITQIFERLFLEINHNLNDPLVRLDSQSSKIVSLVNEAMRINKEIETL